tara:strand:- start:249 stop:515 length:267 start_codon:yes stop_codon:yes gene_type:complete
MIKLKKIEENIFNYDWIIIHDYGYNQDGELITMILETSFGMKTQEYNEEWCEAVAPHYESIEIDNFDRGTTYAATLDALGRLTKGYTK